MNEYTVEQFIGAVKSEVANRTEKQVIIREIRKNNGLILSGLTILEDNINITPNIYLEPFYEEYKKEGLDSVVNTIINLYEISKPTQNLDLQYLLDFETAKKKLGAKLINYEMNKELLENVPHERYMDLAIVPLIRVAERVENNATITVTNQIQSAWKVSTEEIITTALSNISEDFEFAEMGQMMANMGMPELASSGEQDKLYIMTNHLMSNGAIALVQKDAIKKLAEQIGIEKFAVIPSSIHECLLFPFVEGLNDLEELKWMVKQVNEETLNREEILSYNIYLYDRATNELTMA